MKIRCYHIESPSYKIWRGWNYICLSVYKFDIVFYYGITAKYQL